MKKQLAVWMGILGMASLAIVGCDRAAEESESDVPVVVTTTTMLEDLVRELGGEDVKTLGIMPLGADPHVYQPRPGDARVVAGSDAVVMNGLLLEGWMDSLVRHAGGERPVIVASDALDEASLLSLEGAVDPHVWFDVGMWRQVAAHVTDGLVPLVDDEAADRIRARHAAYDEVLAGLDGWVRGQMESIPSGRRVLITSHDAFGYFGRAYGIDVEAIQGLSTEQEASQRDVANIIELVRRTNAPAVFMESSVHPGLIQQVARETDAEAAGPLYSDSLGPESAGAHTYVGMIHANVRMITEALGGDYQAFEVSTNLGVPVDEPAEELLPEMEEEGA